MSSFKEKYFNAALASDVVILDSSGEHVVLIKRLNEPFKDKLAFPGGFLEDEENFKDAAIREAYEEIGVPLKSSSLIELGIYAEPNRDPRGRVVTLSYLVIVDELFDLSAGDDAKEAKWYLVNELIHKKDDFAFDHFKMLIDALNKLKSLKIDRLSDLS